MVASVFDKMMDAMRRAGAVELGHQEIEKLAQEVFTFEQDHYAVKKEHVGADAHILGQLCGANVSVGVDIVFGETDESSPFVSEEQMMPFVPFVRVSNFEQAMDLAIKYEHGFGHTTIIHSNDLDHITRMGRRLGRAAQLVWYRACSYQIDPHQGIKGSPPRNMPATPGSRTQAKGSPLGRPKFPTRRASGRSSFPKSDAGLRPGGGAGRTCRTGIGPGQTGLSGTVARIATGTTGRDGTYWGWRGLSSPGPTSK